MGWIIFAVVALPIIGVLVWLIVDEAFVRIDSGKLGLVVKRGKATDKSLLPGPHFVPVLRRVSVVEYPSLELSYRAGDDTPVDESSDFEHSGPALRVVLGDRAMLDVSYTVRFRINDDQLRMVHERFGPEGIWSAVRDNSARALRAHLVDPTIGIDDLFGVARHELETALAATLRSSLVGDGFELMLFSLGDLDLGRSGEVIQATVRARLELEREEAETATRLAEVRSDAELRPYLAEALSDAALRYRELGVWREIIQTPAGVMVPTPAHARTTPNVANRLLDATQLAPEPVAPAAVTDEP